MTMRISVLSSIIFIFCSMLFTCPDHANSGCRTEPSFSTGDLVYCPVYPSIYHMGQKKGLDLTVTLSIHNISPDTSIKVESVDYYSKKGKLLGKMLENPVKLSPLETATFVLNPKEHQGGVGANCLVRWKADRPVSRPLIQAVMITTSGSQGISFITDGVPVRSMGKE